MENVLEGRLEIPLSFVTLMELGENLFEELHVNRKKEDYNFSFLCSYGK